MGEENKTHHSREAAVAGFNPESVSSRGRGGRVSEQGWPRPKRQAARIAKPGGPQAQARQGLDCMCWMSSKARAPPREIRTGSEGGLVGIENSDPQGNQKEKGKPVEDTLQTNDRLLKARSNTQGGPCMICLKRGGPKLCFALDRPEAGYPQEKRT